MNDLMTKSFTSYVNMKKVTMKDIDLEASLPPSDMKHTSSTTHMDIDMGLFLEEAKKVKTKMGYLGDLLGNLQQVN